ncbi:hypothetical protein RHRU231_230021 [Rhodococcus ruber]|uniref:Uncharacterized protein n=1 Tax=Rhodococcus ruber TaxID=1830 RepID=A0A098BEP8_9NOCA|nr:hypothetical protein RHRU231_230021 [Rhodococcus ruber]
MITLVGSNSADRLLPFRHLRVRPGEPHTSSPSRPRNLHDSLGIGSSTAGSSRSVVRRCTPGRRASRTTSPQRNATRCASAGRSPRTCNGTTPDPGPSQPADPPVHGRQCSVPDRMRPRATWSFRPSGHPGPYVDRRVDSTASRRSGRSQCREDQLGRGELLWGMPEPLLGGMHENALERDRELLVGDLHPIGHASISLGNDVDGEPELGEYFRVCKSARYRFRCEERTRRQGLQRHYARPQDRRSHRRARVLNWAQGAAPIPR